MYRYLVGIGVYLVGIGVLVYRRCKGEVSRCVLNTPRRCKQMLNLDGVAVSHNVGAKYVNIDVNVPPISGCTS